MQLLRTITEAQSTYGIDEGVPTSAFDFTYDDEGCLYSYWITDGDCKEKVHTARGLAGWVASLAQAEFMDTARPQSATGLLATDYALDDYTTWK